MDICNLGVRQGMRPEEILYLIENLREQLNTLALNRHLADTEVVRLSQMLDSFLNLYHKLYPGYSETGIIYFC